MSTHTHVVEPAPSLRNAWHIEWLRALRRRRLFMLNVLIPLLLVVPLAAGGAPPHHAAAVEAVLFALFGTFGAAIPALRDAESGLYARMAATPMNPFTATLGRVLAGASIDTVQLLPGVAAIAITSGTGMAALLAIIAALLGSLVVANLVGLFVAMIARSVAEGALFAAVSTLLLLHASGVFRTPSPDSIGAAIERFAPFRALHETLLAAAASPGSPGAAFAALSAGIVVLTIVLAVVARRGFRSLARARSD